MVAAVVVVVVQGGVGGPGAWVGIEWSSEIWEVVGMVERF